MYIFIYMIYSFFMFRLRSPSVRRRLRIPHNSRFDALHRQPRPMRSSRILPATPRTSRVHPVMRRTSRIFPATPRTSRIIPVATRISRIIPATPRASRTIPATSRDRHFPAKHSARAEDIFARNVEVILVDGSRIGTAWPTRRGSGGTVLARSPMHRQERLSRLTIQGWKPIRRRGERRNTITSRNSGGNTVRSTHTNSHPTGQNDMIAVNDVISLVNAIKGSRGTSTTQNPSSGTSSGSKNISSIIGGNTSRRPSTGNQQRATSSMQHINSAASSGSKNSISVNGGSTSRSSNAGTSSLSNRASSGHLPVDHLGPSMDLLAQFAILNGGEGGILNNLMSDPLFLSQISGNGVGNSASGLSVISPKQNPTQHKTGESSSTTANGRGRTDVIIHPSLVQPSGVVIQPPLQQGSNQALGTDMHETLQETSQELQRDIQELPPFLRQLVLGQGVQ